MKFQQAFYTEELRSGSKFRPNKGLKIPQIRTKLPILPMIYCKNPKNSGAQGEIGWISTAAHVCLVLIDGILGPLRIFGKNALFSQGSFKTLLVKNFNCDIFCTVEMIPTKFIDILFKNLDKLY